MEVEAPIYSKEEFMNAFEEEIVDTKSELSEESVFTETSQKKRVSSYSKRGVPGYKYYYIEKKGKKIKIEYFSTSSNPGSYIVCPLMGVKLNERVGSPQENLYFKVRMNNVSKGDEPITVYYDTPDAFERHHLERLPQKLKDQWVEKRKMYL